MARSPKFDDVRSEQEISRRRDETVKRMVKMPPKTLKGDAKRVEKKKPKAK